MNHFLGIDIGTTGIKTGLYSDEGALITFAKRSYLPSHPSAGAAECDPALWIRGIKETAHEALSGTRGGRVSALALSGLNGLVLVDHGGKPLRNAILYPDTRSVHQAKWLVEHIGIPTFASVTGNRVAPGTFSLPLLLWVRAQEPDLFGKAAKFFAPAGYIGYLLTGQATMEWSRASMTLFFDLQRRCWSPDILSECSLPKDILPDLLAPWETMGRVSKQGSALMDLPEGLPVIAGGMDSLCSALGAGMDKPGIAVDIGGSAGGIATCSQTPILDTMFLNVCHVVPNLWTHIGPMNAAGISVEWLRKVVFTPETEFDAIESAAEKVEPGSGGLLFLPYLLGERCPIWDAAAKGVLYGLTPSHGKGEIARSVLEGVAFGLQHIIESFHDHGVPIYQMRTIGGGSSCRLWRQIKANVTGKPVLLPSVSETATFGAAMIAALGVGAFKNAEEVVKKFVHISQETPVDTAESLKYRDSITRFRQLYDVLKPLFACDGSGAGGFQ